MFLRDNPPVQICNFGFFGIRPGLAFQDEAAWYLDLGPDVDTAANEDWFSIPGLISAGR